MTLRKLGTGEIPWYKVLSNPALKFGRTDPSSIRKGYYMIIAAELANKYYNDSGIKQRILGEDRNPKQIFPEETLKTILEQGQLDAVGAYKHEAVARGLPYITLPPEINLVILHFLIFIRQTHILWRMVRVKQFSENQYTSHLQYPLQSKTLTELPPLPHLSYQPKEKAF